jgi:hypothetical protein
VKTKAISDRTWLIIIIVLIYVLDEQFGRDVLSTLWNAIPVFIRERVSKGFHSQ